MGDELGVVFEWNGGEFLFDLKIVPICVLFDVCRLAAIFEEFENLKGEFIEKLDLMRGVNLLFVLGDEYFIEFTENELFIGLTPLTFWPEPVQEMGLLLESLSGVPYVLFDFIGLAKQGKLSDSLLGVVLGDYREVVFEEVCQEVVVLRIYPLQGGKCEGYLLIRVRYVANSQVAAQALDQNRLTEQLRQ